MWIAIGVFYHFTCISYIFPFDDYKFDKIMFPFPMLIHKNYKNFIYKVWTGLGLDSSEFFPGYHFIGHLLIRMFFIIPVLLYSLVFLSKKTRRNWCSSSSLEFQREKVNWHWKKNQKIDPLRTTTAKHSDADQNPLACFKLSCFLFWPEWRLGTD